jgi:hypothetical protein
LPQERRLLVLERLHLLRGIGWRQRVRDDLLILDE